jgi:hypothetical protein
LWRELGLFAAAYPEAAVKAAMETYGVGEYMVLRGYQFERFAVSERTEYNVEAVDGDPVEAAA